MSAHMVYDTEKIEKRILEREVVKYHLDAAQLELAQTGVRPKHKSGYLSFGEERDSIEHYTERLNTLRTEIAEEQKVFASDSGTTIVCVALTYS